MLSPKGFATRLSYLALEGAYIPREYYVFHDLRLVYMPIYKVGSTSIKTAMLQSTSSTRYPDYMAVHTHGTEGHHVLDPRCRSYFKFAFVRDPFDRLVSCYEDRVRRPVYEPIDRHYFDSDYNKILIRRLFGRKFSPDMSFSSFVELVCSIPDFLADGHFKSQHAWTHRMGRCIPNYIGHLETIGDDWTSISERFGFPDVPIHNPSNRRSAEEYFNSPELIDLAAARYYKDISTFGYEERCQSLRQSAAIRG